MALEATARVPAPQIDLTAALEEGLAHHRAGRFEDAAAIYRRVLDNVPDQPNALHLLGMIESERGNPARGAELIQKSLQWLGEVPEPHVDLGNVLRAIGKRDEAAESYRRALALRPDFALAHACLGGLLGEMGRFEAALGHCRTAIALDPKLVPARMNFAIVLQNARRGPEAARAWSDLIQIQPDRVETFIQLAGQLISTGSPREALMCVDRAIFLQPDNVLAHCARGHALMRLYDSKAAEACFRRALELSPTSKDALAGLGWALRLQGRFDEADGSTRRLKEVDPADLRDVAHLVATGGQTASAEEIARLEVVLEDERVKPDDRIIAGFSVGRLLDAARRYDEAFARYAEANALMLENWPVNSDRFDAEVFHQSIDALIASNTPDYLAEAAATGNVSELPVFVTGMPRSGTTLVEQICASHSRVFGAGELDLIPRLAHALVHQRAPGMGLTEAARRTADASIVQLHGMRGRALRVIDKLPDNILLAGVIARLFPRARIIYCSRDARDISLSCFFQRFIGGAQHFSYDLLNCGKRCIEVQRLASHWLKLMPLHMIEVNYEKLVNDLEGESRRLIEFLGLDWEPACLDFHRTERTVATVSHWQVRQPIYSSSISRWRNYEKHLGPLFAVLAEPKTAVTD